MQEAERPLRRTGLVERQLGDELLIHDPTLGRVYLLDLVTAAVWDLCDGRQGTQQIVREIANASGQSAQSLEAAVRSSLQQLRNHEILVPAHGPERSDGEACPVSA